MKLIANPETENLSGENLIIPWGIISGLLIRIHGRDVMNVPI